MVYDPARHHRRSIRLRGHTYDHGAYFVTIRTRERFPVLARIIAESVQLTALGEIVEKCWKSIPIHHPHVTLDAWVVMPDHLHGILVVQPAHLGDRNGADSRNAAIGDRAPNGPSPGSVGAVVGTFKAAATREVNRIQSSPGLRFWQRNYYEHIVRDAADMGRIREYIITNPARWGRGADIHGDPTDRNGSMS